MRKFGTADIVKHFKREEYLEYVDENYDPNYYLYEILGIGVHTETNEKVVIYKSLYTSFDSSCKIGDIFVRPYDMFVSEVDHEKYPNVKQKYRFEKAGNVYL